ncbi:FAS-associated death domain protein [Onthophagus taurus]|uniref:FAS-associated death domain protein n=1 Tax=Onthophagus taurus TaxID=166361 RepID=UPI0039BDCBF4
MTRYQDLYHYVRAASWPDAVISDIKFKYKDIIASNRQLAACKNITDFLYILEKRDELNEENYVILEDLYILLRDVNESHPQQKGNLETRISPEVRVLPVVPNGLYKRLEQVISLKIGHKWKDFARGLGILEGQIDELEDRHKNISDRIRDVLEFHEHCCPKQFLYSSIYNALCLARRKDLALDVQLIIDTN